MKLEKISELDFKDKLSALLILFMMGIIFYLVKLVFFRGKEVSCEIDELNSVIIPVSETDLESELLYYSEPELPSQQNFHSSSKRHHSESGLYYLEPEPEPEPELELELEPLEPEPEPNPKSKPEPEAINLTILALFYTGLPQNISKEEAKTAIKRVCKPHN